MKYLGLIIGIFALIFTFSSCETDFDLNAPYEKTAVIFGFLDVSADTQYVRIQKTFLGEGDAFEFALVEDSSLFNNVDAKISWTNNNGSTLGTVTLDTMTIHNKSSDGVFFAPDQLVFFVPSSDIDFNENYTYHLTVEADGKEYSSSTNIVEMLNQDIELPLPENIGNNEEVLVTGQPPNVIYQNKTIRFKTSENARRYGITLEFNYIEHRMNEEIERTIVFNLPDQQTDSDVGNETIELEFNAESFYSFISDNVVDDPDVIYREFNSLDYVFTLAAEDLHNYILVNEPVTGIVQDRPEYTNINGGIGIFSSRHRIVRSKFLNFPSIRELATGQYTGGMCFCDPNAGSTYECGTITGCQ